MSTGDQQSSAAARDMSGADDPRGRGGVYAEAVRESGLPSRCTAEELVGVELRDHDGVSCECLVTDPFPPAQWPLKTNKNRRFFLYTTIARLLGATGSRNRVRLPTCVQAAISERYGESEGPATTVGFRPHALE